MVWNPKRREDRDELCRLALRGDPRLFRAVNTHHDLIESLRDALRYMDAWGDDSNFPEVQEVYQSIRRTLAKAEGKEEALK